MPRRAVLCVCTASLFSLFWFSPRLPCVPTCSGSPPGCGCLRMRWCLECVPLHTICVVPLHCVRTRPEAIPLGLFAQSKTHRHRHPNTSGGCCTPIRASQLAEIELSHAAIGHFFSQPRAQFHIITCRVVCFVARFQFSHWPESERFFFSSVSHSHCRGALLSNPWLQHSHQATAPAARTALLSAASMGRLVRNSEHYHNGCWTVSGLLDAQSAILYGVNPSLIHSLTELLCSLHDCRFRFAAALRWIARPPCLRGVVVAATCGPPQHQR
jgi:hypothetical protein